MEKEENKYPPRARLDDGTEVRLVPLERTGKPLYVSRDGRAFSYVQEHFRLIKPFPTAYPRNKYNGGRKQQYLKMHHRHHHILIHRAVLLAWVGPCPEGYEADHLNGITTDNRIENLEWVTPAENVRRAVEMRRRKRLTEQGKAALQARQGLLIHVKNV